MPVIILNVTNLNILFKRQRGYCPEIKTNYCYLQKIHFKYKDVKRLKVKEQKKTACKLFFKKLKLLY